MKKYFVLYLAPVAEMEKMMRASPEEMKKGMTAWNMWMGDNESIFADMGSPLGKTKSVTKDGISATKNEVAGYSIIEAGSHDAAAMLLDDHPHLMIPGASIEVMEIMPMPSM